MGGATILRGIGLGVLAMLLNVAAAFLWVLFYSIAVAPGHDGAFYQAYAQSVAPIAAIVAGLPILLACGWLAARGRNALPAGLIPAIVYILLDFAMVAAGGLWPPFWLLLLSWLTKIAAAWAGARLRMTRTAA